MVKKTEKRACFFSKPKKSKKIKKKPENEIFEFDGSRLCEIDEDVINDIAKAKTIVNSTITNTSIITVTPSTVCVKGPFARNSEIIAIADAGERATKMAPIIKDTDILVFLEKSSINGIISETK